MTFEHELREVVQFISIHISVVTVLCVYGINILLAQQYETTNEVFFKIPFLCQIVTSPTFFISETWATKITVFTVWARSCADMPT